MRAQALLAVNTCVTALMMAACTSAGSTLMELQRVKAGELDVVLLSSHDALRHGQDSFVIEFRSSDGLLTDVGQVKASATMPMPGMPMFGTLDVTPTATQGRYEVVAKFDMAGTWRISLEWQGKATKGTATFSGSVQ